MQDKNNEIKHHNIVINNELVRNFLNFIKAEDMIDSCFSCSKNPYSPT